MDVLVEFDPNHTPSLLDVVRMERELTALMGRNVDLRTPEDLGRRIRQEVVSSALVQYESR